MYSWMNVWKTSQRSSRSASGVGARKIWKKTLRPSAVAGQFRSISFNRATFARTRTHSVATRSIARGSRARGRSGPYRRPLTGEARPFDRVATEFVRVRANVARLNEIDRNWPATAEGRNVFFQIFRAPTPEADRLLLWDVFQTFIHEYMHTLAHAAYSAYANTFGSNSNEWNTLIEGVDSLLTEIVWTAIEPRADDEDMREKIEGPSNAAQPPVKVPHASQRRYPSYTEALHLSDLIGIENIYAAYFLGLVDRIGGPAPAAPGGTP